jgi:hypothetical protein
MSRQDSPEAGTPALPSTPERKLLERFKGRNSGFQASSRSSYLQHERWRNEVLRGLKLLEAEGLVMVQQLVPCHRHGKCGGQPVAAGCELTLEGQRARSWNLEERVLHLEVRASNLEAGSSY